MASKMAVLMKFVLACTKTRNNEMPETAETKPPKRPKQAKRPKRPKRNHRNERNDRNKQKINEKLKLKNTTFILHQLYPRV